MKNKFLIIVTLCGFVMAFPLVASGAIDIIDKSQYYFLEADEVTLKNNDNEFLFFSYKEGWNIKTFSYMLLGGTKVIFDENINEPKDIVLRKNGFLGKAKIIIIDKENNEVLLETDKEEIQITLENSKFSIIVVGDYYCGDIQLEIQ